MTDRLADFVRQFEGLHDGDKRTPQLEPELCPAGYWTLGWGATTDARGQTVTKTTRAIDLAEAEMLFVRDLGVAGAALRRWISVPLKIGQAIALISFIYNLGAGRFQGSTLRAKINRGEMEGAASEFSKWVYGGGRVLPGLVARRAAERALFTAL